MAAAVVVGLAAVAFGVAAQTFKPSDLTGPELFERYCSPCHGSTGHGDGPVAPSLNKLVPDLTRLALRHGGTFPTAEVREIIDGRSPVIAHGTRKMPVWGYEFWVEEGADIVAEDEANEIIGRLIEHLESIQEPQATGPQRR